MERASIGSGRQVRVLLFDLDGTLLDSREFLVHAQYETIEAYYPGKFSHEFVQENFGNGLQGLLPDTVSEKSQNALQAFKSLKIQGYHKTKLFPGVLEGLQSLKEKGFQLGIVTNQDRSFSEAALKQHKILAWFDFVIAREEVQERKPSPEGILKVVREQECRKQEVIMIGDSRVDIIAGQRAGVLTGFLKWYPDTVIPTDPLPDFVCENFEMLKAELTRVK